MSKYEIKSYQESFLEAQEKVGTEATKDWRGFGQTPAAQLKQAYSREGFDPETKLYAFKGDEMVAFLTSSIVPESEDGIKRANLEFALCLPGHEECSDLLFEKAVENLKEKGIQRIQTRVGDIYKGTVEKAKKHELNYSRDLYILMAAKVKDLSAEESEIEVLEFDESRDLEQMLKIFVDELGASEEYAKANFERIAKDKETFAIHMVIREDDKIVGRVLAYRSQNDPKEFNFGNLYYVDDKYFSPLLSTAISKIKELGAEKTSLFLYGDTLPLEEKYKSFGFSQSGKIDFYEKEI
ncbi:MAG: hypothetical protein GNW80_11450 [Asgard group archaeon]|nr:hypothetical protein [Asgard group archaeon]